MNNKFRKTWLFMMWLSAFSLLFWSTTNAAMITMNWRSVNVWDETIRATNVMYRAWVTKLPLERQNLFWNSQRWEAALLIKRFWNKVKKLASSYEWCSFSDTSHLSWDIPMEIVESCNTWLFQWAHWKFLPNEKFTRWQTILVFARLLAKNQAPFKEWSFTSQLNNAYNYLLKRKIINVDDRHNHQRAVTREEMYLMMYRIVQLWKNWWHQNWWVNLDLSIIKKTFDSIDLNKWLQWNVNNDNANNDLEQSKAEEILNTKWTDFNVVAFKDKTVFDQSVLPTWSSRIILQKIWVKNNMSEDLELEKVKFDLRWLVSYKDITKVYLLSDDFMYSSTSTFRSSWEATVYARRWFNKIKSWETKYYYVAIDSNSDSKLASNTFSLNYSLEFNKENAKVWWSLNQKTIEYRFVSYTTQAITIEWYNSPATKVYVWDEQKLIWSFQLEVWSTSVKSTKDVYLKKIILTNEWTKIDDKLKNVKFKVDWKVVSDKVEISRDKISAEFRTPVEKDENWKEKKVEDSTVLLERWESMQVDVYADIIWWANDDKIKLTLKNEWDLIAIEKWTMLPLSVKKIWHQYFKEFLIQAWKLVISKSSKSPIVETISPDSKELEVLRFKIANPSDVNLDSFKVFFSVNNKSTDNIQIDDLFRNVKLYKCSSKKDWEASECNSVVDTLSLPSEAVNAWTSKNNVKLSFDNFNNIKSWDTYYAIKVQTSRFAKENVDFKFVVNKDSFDKPENVNTEDKISSNSIVWSADSNFWSIWKSNINVNYMNNWEDLDFVKWKANATAWEFVISSNNIQDLKINQLRLQFISDTPTSVHYDQITNVRLEYNWNTSENRDVDSNWYVTFDWLNIRIKKWEQLKLKVKFDISSAFTQDVTTKKLTVKIWDASQNLIMTTSSWQSIKSEAIWWLPIASEDVRVHNSWKLYMYKSSNQKDVKTLYDYNKFEDVFEFTLKSKYDDIRIKDLYVIAYKWAYSKDWWTAANIVEDAWSFINQIRYNWWTSADANVIRWIAKFENLNDDIKANSEKNVKISVKTNNIRQADKDNKKVKFAIVYKIQDAAHQEYKTKVISLSNWEILWDTSVDWSDELESKEISVRKTMIKVDTKDNWLDKNIINWSEHQAFKLLVENKWSWKAKVKQLMFPITISNSWNPIVMNNFKLEFTSDWENSFKSWSSIRNNIQFAVKQQWVNLEETDWKDPSEISITEAGNRTYNLYVRFTWDYNNWVEVQWQRKIAFRLKTSISWSDNVNDSIKFDFKTYEDALDWDMKAYANYSTWLAANNAIIWTDNADSNSNTNVDHVNWFEDQWVEWNYNSHTLSYKS